MSLAETPPRDRAQYQAALVKARKLDRAQLAREAAEHVPDAIKEVARLMKHAKREGVRLKAAIQLIEWAAEVEVDHSTGTKVYVLANQSTSEMAERLRNRLQRPEDE